MSRRLTPCTIIPPELYVLRDADKQLRNVIEDMGRPGYVLVARQMGKTNLLLNAQRELQNDKNAIVYVDVSPPFTSERECFRYIIDTALQARSDVFAACEEAINKARRAPPPPSYREHENELRALLDAIPGKLVIILDEIDSLTKAPFCDKIFAQIRSVYFAGRTNYRQFKRLTYALSGVAEPNEIIKDKRISPFNIGEKIYLDDFAPEQFLDFLNRAGLDLTKDTQDRIYFWANGNPRLTWDICYGIEEKLAQGYFATAEAVDDTVKTLYLTDFTKEPINNIRELVIADDELRNGITVIKYGKGNTLPDATKNKLYLAGIIRSVASQKSVAIKNRIIEAALSDQWLLDVSVKKKGLAKIALERYEEHRYEEALSLYEQLIGNPDLSEREQNAVYYEMGLCAYHAGEYQSAITYFGKTRLDKTATPRLYYERTFYIGACYLQVGNIEASRKEFEETLKTPTKNTTYVSTLINLGTTYSAEKNFARAIELHREAMEFVESSSLLPEEKARYIPLALYSLGKAFGDMGDIEKSKAHFEQALKAANPTQRPAIMLGMCQQITAKGEREQILRQCVELIITDNLHPDSSQPEGTLELTTSVFYRLLNETYRASRPLFDRLFTFAGTLDEVKASDATLLLRLAYMSVGTRDFDAAARMARDVVETPIPGLAVSSDSEFQSYRLLCLLMKGKDRQRYRHKYVECLKSGYEPKAIDSVDIEVFVDLANELIESKKAKEALDYIVLAKQYKPLLARDQIASFAAVHFYEMVAYQSLNLRTKLRSASQETLVFLESLAGRPTNTRLMSAEGLQSIEGFARENLGEEVELFTRPTPFRSARKIGRNDRISVRYADGTVKTDKFKRLEPDLVANRCVLVDGSS